MANFFKQHWPKLIVAVVFLMTLKVLLWPCNFYQGWGGDYAGYLSQTRCIAEGKSTQETNYIYNPAMPYLAPPAYPMGFSIVLTPFYLIYGLDLMVFVKFVTLTWWMVGIVLFMLLRKHFSIAVSLVASVFFLFNPHFFSEKNAILPDYLFACWLLLGTYWYVHKDRGKLANAVICGALAGMAWITRANGVILLLALYADVVLEQIATWRREKKVMWLRGEWVFAGVASLVAIAIQLLVHEVLFKLPKGGSYMDQLKYGDSFVKILRTNLDTNLNIIINFFQLGPVVGWEIKNTDIAVKIGGAIALGFSVMGFLIASGRAFRFYRVLFVLFMAVLVVWPMAQGLRYLVPATPLMVMFCIAGIRQLQTEGKFAAIAKWWVIPLLLYGAYYHLDKQIGNRNLEDEVGSPEYPVNQEAYRYIKDSLPDSVRLAYQHPLILGLYAERKCFKWSRDEIPVEQEFQQYRIDYLLINNWGVEFDEKMKKFVQSNPPELIKIWSNDRNDLYKVQLK